MYNRVAYFNAACELRAMWVSANVLAECMTYRRFTWINAERFSAKYVELDFYINFGVSVAPIRRAITRAANMAGVADREVITALAETSKFVCERVIDYLNALADRNVHNIPLSADILTGVYGQTKFILQCLIMALLNE